MTANKRSGGAFPGKGREGNGCWIDAGSLLGEGIGLVFTDRRGGVSSPPFDTLNLAYHTGDEPDAVRLNRGRVSAALGVEAGDIVYLEQVHGLRVARAVSRQHEREVEKDEEAALAATDGVYTTESGLVLSVLTADCAPIALAAPRAGIVAMLHAGWRGTIGNIVGATMHMLREDLGVDPIEVKAVIGPAIGTCCYEVDKGRARLFVERYGGGSAVVMGKDDRNIDLTRANLLNLLEEGVKEENIGMAGGCTCCDPRYFSFRRDGVTGRQGAFIFLKG